MPKEVKLNNLSPGYESKSKRRQPSRTMKINPPSRQEISVRRCRKIVQQMGKLPSSSMVLPVHGIITPPHTRSSHNLWNKWGSVLNQQGSVLSSEDGMNMDREMSSESHVQQRSVLNSEDGMKWSKELSTESQAQQTSMIALEEHISSFRLKFEELGDMITENGKQIEYMKEQVVIHEKRFEQENNQNQTVKNQTHRTKKIEDDTTALKMRLDTFSKNQKEIDRKVDENLKVTLETIEIMSKQVIEVSKNVNEMTCRLKQLGQIVTTNTHELNSIRYICDKTQSQQGKMESQIAVLMSSTNDMGTNIDKHKQWVSDIVGVAGYGGAVVILMGIVGLGLCKLVSR